MNNTSAKIAYKIFYVMGDKYFSVNAGLNDATAKQEYFPSQENFPKFGNPIFCFDTLNNAKSFYRYYFMTPKKFEIWRVLGETDELTYIPVNNFYNKSVEGVLELFKKHYNVFSPSKGTIGMKSILMLERIK